VTIEVFARFQVLFIRSW